MIVPYLRGYGTTRFLSERDPPQRPASGAGGRHHRADGRARRSSGDRRRLRLGRADGRHRRGAVAGALQGAGLGQRLPDRQPARPAGCRCRRRPSCQWWYQFYFATDRGRAGYDSIPARVRQAHLADRLAEVGLRRRDVRAHRGGLRQPRSRRHRDPQLPLAARPGRRRGAIRRPGTAAGRRPRHHRARPSPWKATPTARRTRTRAPTPAKFSGTIRAPHHHRRRRAQPAAGGAARRSPRRSSTPVTTEERKCLPTTRVWDVLVIARRRSRSATG